MLNLYEVTIVTNKRSKKEFCTGENPKEAREDVVHYFREFDMEVGEYIFGCITRLINSDL